MNFIIISLSLLVSTIVSVLILKKKNDKLISMLSAFVINTTIIVIVTSTLYSMDAEAELFGFGFSGLYACELV